MRQSPDNPDYEKEQTECIEKMAINYATTLLYKHLQIAANISAEILMFRGWTHDDAFEIQQGWGNPRYGNKLFSLRRAFELQRDRLNNKPSPREPDKHEDYRND